jgi:hypothetical protein
VVANLLLQARRLAPLVHDKQTLTHLLTPYQPAAPFQPRAREGLTTQ